MSQKIFLFLLKKRVENCSTVRLALLDFPSSQFQAVGAEASFQPGMLFQSEMACIS